MTEERLRVESAPPPHFVGDREAVGEAPAVEPAAVEDSSVQGAKETAQQVAGPAKEKAREVAGRAKEHAQAAAGQAKSQAAARVDEKSTQVGVQIGSQGEALEGVAGELRRQGKDGQARVAGQAAEKVKAAGAYLQQADGESLIETASNIARENPAAAAAVGAAAGFAAGRVIKASSPDPSADDAPDAPAAAGEAPLVPPAGDAREVGP